MTIDSVNYLNIFLMVFSAGAAFALPFQVFLFAYAVLGPLHYLTEISWLHDRGYYLKGKYDYLLPFGICGLFGVVSLLKWEPYTEGQVQAAIQYIAFFGVTALMLARRSANKLALLALVVLSFFVAERATALRVVFAIFLPTLVHVFVFTGAFILIGALKSRSRSGFASLAVFALCALSFFLYAPAASRYQVSPHVRELYRTFELMNRMLIKGLALGPVRSADDLYRSQAGLTVMRFIAFAYLYHYLNWFSKTSIIKWNQISATRAFWIAALWLASLAIYAYDYQTGFLVLLSLSILHVFLEFPLDQQTLVSAGRELYALTSGVKSERAAPDRAGVRFGSSGRPSADSSGNWRPARHCEPTGRSDATPAGCQIPTPGPALESNPRRRYAWSRCATRPAALHHTPKRSSLASPG